MSQMPAKDPGSKLKDINASPMKNDVVSWLEGGGKCRRFLPLLKFGCLRCMQLMRQRCRRQFCGQRRQHKGKSTMRTAGYQTVSAVNWAVSEDHSVRMVPLTTVSRLNNQEANAKKVEMALSHRLKWVDALNAWIPDKEAASAENFTNFVTSPPRVKHLIASKQGKRAPHELGRSCTCRRFEDHMHSFGHQRFVMKTLRGFERVQTDDDVMYMARSHKSYTSPLYDPQNTYRARAVHFTLPMATSSAPQPAPPQEPRDVPAILWEEEEALEEAEYEVAQAQEVNVRELVVVVHRASTSLHPALDAVVVAREPSAREQAPDEGDDVTTISPTTSRLQADAAGDSSPAPLHLELPLRAGTERGGMAAPRKSLSPCSPLARVGGTVEKKAKPKLKKGTEPEIKEKPPVRSVKPQASPEKAVKPAAALKQPKQAKPVPAKAAKPVKQTNPLTHRTTDAKSRKPVSRPTPKTMVVGRLKELRSASEEPGAKPMPLPISLPEDMELEPEAGAQTQHEPAKSRSPARRRERVVAPPQQQAALEQPPSPPEVQPTKRESWIFSDDDDKEEAKEETCRNEKPEETCVKIDLPELPSALPTLPQRGPRAAARDGRSLFSLPIAALSTKQRWGKMQRDTSLRDEEQRARLAEERRVRHQHALDKRRSLAKTGLDKAGECRDSTQYEDDYGFLAKYCILTPASTEKYRYTFESVDEGGKGYLTEEETAYGLRAINPSLSASERTYLFRVLEMIGHRMSMGTDQKLFSILAALSQRVSKLDEWARNMMAELDYKNLERKLFMCKTLWECNVDMDTSTISLAQLIVELRAGGISPAHEEEVRCKLGYLRALDFFDFLMYVPLFILIHENVVSDPLSDRRNI